MNIACDPVKTTLIQMNDYQPETINGLFTKVDVSWPKNAYARFAVSRPGELGVPGYVHVCIPKSRHDEGAFEVDHLRGRIERQRAVLDDRGDDTTIDRDGGAGAHLSGSDDDELRIGQNEVGMAVRISARWLRMACRGGKGEARKDGGDLRQDAKRMAKHSPIRA